MKVKDFLEKKINEYRLSDDDLISIDKKIDMGKHWLLSAACAEWINVISDDQAFCDAEWNFMQYWRDKKGLSENDLRYIEACGYDRDQFEKGA